MSPDELDRILSGEEQIVPSSGFTSAVMDRLHGAALEPEPIPFPWKRALPGIVAAAMTLVGVPVVLFGLLAGGGTPSAVAPAASVVNLETVLAPAIAIGAHWLALALLLTLATLAFVRRLARRPV